MLNPLSRRIETEEILDDGGHPDDELFGTFRDMGRVNQFLGGVTISLAGLKRLTGHLRPGDALQVLDVGTGHADIPRAVGHWASSQNFVCHLIGVDLDLATIATARMLPENKQIRFLQGNILDLPLGDKQVDIAMCSMTLHHLSDIEAVTALQEMARVSRLGIVVNDLTRSAHGYAVAWMLGRVATKNRLTRHDAHRSVLRSRTVFEMEQLAQCAGLQRPVFDSALGYRVAMTVGVRAW